MRANPEGRAARPGLPRRTTARVARNETRPATCAVCAGPLGRRPGPGRPRRTCSSACRQAAQRRRDRGLAESTPLVQSRGRRSLAALVADRQAARA